MLRSRDGYYLFIISRFAFLFKMYAMQIFKNKQKSEKCKEADVFASASLLDMCIYFSTVSTENTRSRMMPICSSAIFVSSENVGFSQ